MLKFPIILDGATGSELIARGLPTGVCPEEWILNNPDVAQGLQKEYIASGSRVVLAPTFGASLPKLSQYGLSDRIKEMNEALVKLSKTAAGEDAIVAGDVSASGLFIAPYGDESMQSLVDIYSAQLCHLHGADILLSETNITIADARAAVIAAKRIFDKPVFVTFTMDADGRTVTGASAAAALVIFRAMGVSAFGFNCGAGPAEMVGVAKKISELAKGFPIIAKPNAGLPTLCDGEEKYSMEPREFASYAEELAQSGVLVFGGCCGTGPKHIRALADKVLKLSFENPSYSAEEYLATEREIIRCSDVSMSEEITCSEFLMDDLMDCLDVCPLVRIACDEDVKNLEENQHAAAMPVIIACDDDNLLDKALLSYNGRAGVKSAAPRAQELAKFYGAYIFG